MIAQRLTERLAQPFVAENRAGANGNLAGELTARASPDGYVLFLATNGNLSINPAIYGPARC
ncbi:MAG: tripartite tricarboxylate transporter substrate-binding protein [Burkholderiales bacterium]